MGSPLTERHAQLNAVIKTAQYLAGLGSDRDIWFELGQVAVHFLGADLAAFLARRADGRWVQHHCVAPGSGCDRLLGAAEDVVAQVLDSGFLASERLSLDDEYAVAFLPLGQDTPNPVVLALGHRTAEHLSHDALNLYLAVAGLFQSTLTRLASQHRFLAMADNVPEMLFQLTCYPDGKAQFTYVSGGSRDALGVSPGDIMGDTAAFASGLAREDRIRFAEATTRATGRISLVLRWCRGGERHLLLNAMPTPQEDGSTVWDGALQDVTERERMERERQEYLLRLEKSMEATVEVMASTIEMRDPYTAGHQRKVGELARAIAEEMGLPPEEVHGISIAGRIHDIGKIHVPSDILSYPGKLGEAEYALVKTHPQIGYEILKVVDFPWPVAEMVLEHHERLDGSGYPKGLKGDQIILGARIIAVADVAESIASFRPYRPALGPQHAVEELVRNRGRLYDPNVVDACLGLVRSGYRLEAS